MTADNCFELSWRNHQSTVIDIFDTLLKAQTFVDVTLASEGKWLRAHRLVLSACSDYFEELLTLQSDKNAIIYLKDVPFSHLEALIEFMYRGNVNVEQNELQNFINTANSLRIRGLSDVSHGTQLLADQTVDKLAETSLNQSSASSPVPEMARTRSVTASNRPATTNSTRRSKRHRSESCSETVTPALLKRTSQMNGVPTFALTSTDSTTLAGRNESAAQTQSSFPQITTSSSILVPSMSSNQDQILTSSGKEIESAEELLCRITVPKLELEEVDLDTVTLDNIVPGSEEEWSDVEGQDHSQEEWKGLGTEESGRNDAVNGGEGGSKSRSEKPASSNLNSTGASSGRFACPQCPRSYKNLRDLQSHRRNECQNVARRFSCTMCDYKGKRMYHLDRHLKRVHKAKA